MSIQPQAISVIPNASMSQATSWLLTSSGAFVDTQTITIGGVVFTTVTALSVGPAVAGEVLIGANAAATIVNLAAAINTPDTTTTTFTALSANNANKIKNIFGLTGTATSATVLTVTSSVVKPGGNVSLVVSETETNAAWTTSTTSTGGGGNGFGRASLQFISSSISSGNGVFTVDVSNDGTNWTAYNRLTTNVTNTNAQTDTRVASVTLSTNTTSLVMIPDPVAFFRVTIVVTTDGAYSASAYII